MANNNNGAVAGYQYDRRCFEYKPEPEPEMVLVLVDAELADVLIARGLAIPQVTTCTACGGHMTTIEEEVATDRVTFTKASKSIPVTVRRTARACDRCEIVEVLL